MDFDKDLQSIQEVRNMVAKAKQAQKELAEYSEDRINSIIKAIAESCAAQAEHLAKMAVEETGFGIAQDKLLKNLLGSTMTYEYIKDQKTTGIIKDDPGLGIMEVAVPMGVIAALIPSTNPTSTTMYKAIISIKAGNSIIISPHPGARKCIQETARIITEAAKRAGAPDGIVQCISVVTKEATDALICHRSIGMILATGGEAMVRAAYSSGNPAIGVGPGNGPAYIEKTADIPAAVCHIIESKTFDNGTICASEQSIVTELCIKEKVISELKSQGGYFLNEEQSNKLAGFILRSNGTMNPKIVGKSAAYIAKMAGLSIPDGTRVLISEQTTVSRDNPYAREKLCPILAFYTEDSWQSACNRCIELLSIEGAGHTMTIHSQDKAVIKEFALKKPVSRLLVNTAASLGGVGVTTSLQPSFTLGCGSVGGSSTSDNVGPQNLINIRRVAYGVRELCEIRGSSPCPPNAVSGQAASAERYAAASVSKPTAAATTAAAIIEAMPSSTLITPTIGRNEIEAITRAVIARLSKS